MKFQRIAKELTQSPAFKAASAQEIRKDAAKDQIRLLETLNVIQNDKIRDLYSVIEQSPEVGIGEINWQDILNRAGVSVAKVSQEMTISQVKKAVGTANSVGSEPVPASSTNGSKRLRIKQGELDDHLSEGYEPIFNLQNGDVVVEM
ncbi:MAG: hypothetical protein ACRDF4_02890 [Rhabdochlamydiaceae bacterium]